MALPPEMLEAVFAFASPEARGSAAAVCRRWRAVLLSGLRFAWRCRGCAMPHLVESRCVRAVNGDLGDRFCLRCAHLGPLAGVHWRCCDPEKVRLRVDTKVRPGRRGSDLSVFYRYGLDLCAPLRLVLPAQRCAQRAAQRGDVACLHFHGAKATDLCALFAQLTSRLQRERNPSDRRRRWWYPLGWPDTCFWNGVLYVGVEQFFAEPNLGPATVVQVSLRRNPSSNWGVVLTRV